MNKKDTVELFKMIRSVFPQFDVDQYKVDTWTRLLKDQDPERLMRMAEKALMTSKFPPTIADLRERKETAYSSNILEKIKEWEANATRKQ